MGITAHERVRRHFGVTTMIESYDDLFRSISDTATFGAPQRLLAAAASAEAAASVGDQVAG
jgi:hypothetical protein